MRTFFKGLFGFLVAIAFIAKAICTPQLWRHYKTFSSRIPGLEALPQNNILLARQLALEIAKRILLSFYHLTIIGGLFLDHLAICSNFPISDRLFRLVFLLRLKHEVRERKELNSYPKSDAQKQGLSSVINVDDTGKSTILSPWIISASFLNHLETIYFMLLVFGLLFALFLQDLKGGLKNWRKP